MIAPRTNLVVWATAIIFPLSILAGVFGSFRAICILGIVIFGLASLIDLLLGLGRYRHLEVQLSPVNRVVAGRHFQLNLKLSGTRLRRGTIRLAVDLPASIETDHPHTSVKIDGQISDLIVPIDARTDQRGTYPILRLFFDWVSPFRFWVFREERLLKSELRVYPDLALEGREIAHFLNRGGFGVHRQRQVGRGREFEKLREYEPGDSFDSIHWKAAAKRHKPITKVFQVEKSQEVYLAIDASRLSGRTIYPHWPQTATNSAQPSTVFHRSPITNHQSQPHSSSSSVSQSSSSSSPTVPDPIAGHASDFTRAGTPPFQKQTTILERSIAAALLAGATAERQGDLFGLITFSDKVDQLVRARSGSIHFTHCRDLLVNLQTKWVAPDFEDIAATLLNRLTKRSLLIFLASLDDPVTGENFLLAARFLARRHLVMAIMLSPPGTQPLFSAPGVVHTEEIYENIAGHLRWAKLQELRKQLLQAGVRFHLAPSQSFTLTVVSEYLATKRLQLL